jgi:hypothetical protein
MKTIWGITKSITGKSTKKHTKYELDINGNENNSRQDIAESFSMCFIPVMENTVNNISLNLK